MAFDLALLNGKAFMNGKVSEANLFIRKGRIAKISRSSQPADQTIDCTGLLILPGAIDSHVHFREPGFSTKEDWATGSAAAAAGGICTVLEMPNTRPPTTTVKLLEEKRKLAAKKSIVNFGLFFGAASGNGAEMKKAKGIAGFKAYMGTTTGDLKVESDSDVLRAFKIAKSKKIPVAVHAQDEALLQHYESGVKQSGREDPLAYCDANPVAVAVRGLERAIIQASIAKNQLHICHVSSIEEVQLISEARKAGIKITCETAPHYLFLNRKDVERLGNFGKMNPPLRSERERLELLRAFSMGLIDISASDHAPHTREEKSGSVWKAASGVPGVQTTLPLLLNEHAKGNLSLQRIVEATSFNPAQIFGFSSKGEIALGYDADLSIVDLKREWLIRDEFMLSKCGWTPFHGMKIKGMVAKTVVRGEPVFEGEIL